MIENKFEGVGASNEKYKLLSYQLFGPPTNSMKSYNGPCVNLCTKQSANRTYKKSQKEVSRVLKNREVNYCLICYSNDMENTLDPVSLDELTKLLKIVTKPVKRSNNTVNNSESGNFNASFELLLGQLADKILHLCVTCNAAYKNLAQVYQQLKNLEQEVNTFKAKFVNVVKLSKKIAESDAVANGIVICNTTTDNIRTFLLDGELNTNMIKEERINDVDLGKEEKLLEELDSNDMEVDCNFCEDNLADRSTGSDDDSVKSMEKAKKLVPSIKNKLPRKHKGKPGTKRLSIEDLKRTKSNKEYVKWRKMYGNKMSLTAYKKMRREDLSKLQNAIENKGIPTRSNIGKAGLKVSWMERDDGKLEYLGFEVIKNDDGTFSCSLCIHENLKPSKTRKSIGDHIKRRHVEVSNGHACEKCDARFFFHYQLTQHLEEKHLGIQCKICGLSLANRSNLSQHERVKHQGIKAHICEHCGKGFATVKDMTIHVRRHTGERPFVCHLCAKTFIDKQSMKIHIRKKHSCEYSTEVKSI